MNDMDTLRAMRAEVPEPSQAQTRAGEVRLVAHLRREAPRVRQGRPAWRPYAWRAGLAAGLVAAVAVGTVVVRGAGPADRPDQHAGTGTGTAGPRSGTGPAMRLTSAAQVLDLAARAADSGPEFDPRPDQFIVYRSTTMYVSEINGTGRYLDRSNRTIWLSVDGTRDGTLEVEHLEPRAIPGWPIPARARDQVGDGLKRIPLPGCANTDPARRRDFTHLKTLPTDPAAMLAHLRSGADNGNPADERAFTAAGDLIRESYLPAPQRAALYRALGLIPALTVIQQAEDAAGRTGVAVAYRDDQRGVSRELIFDPQTFRFLGEREFVVDAAKAGAPVGTQLASTAELSVTVADSAPGAPDDPKNKPDC